MKTIESTTDASHLSGSIEVSDTTLDEIAEWIENLDKTPRLTREEAYTGDTLRVDGYIVEVELFEDSAHVSIRDSEDKSTGALLRVEELLSIVP